jgi:hypothetical protein
VLVEAVQQAAELLTPARAVSARGAS